jgi:hypothetical protein
MACGCRGKKSNDSRAVSAASSVRYEVWLEGVYAGRTFTSLMQAQKYANKIGGEVRTA